MEKRYLLIMVGCFVVGVVAGAILMWGMASQTSNTGNTDHAEQQTCTATAVNDRQYYQIATSYLQGANRSIHISMYVIFWYNYNNDVKSLVNLLATKDSLGVEVKVFLDNDTSNDLVRDNNNLTASYLRNRGVEVRFDSPNITTHTKLIIIDSEVVLVGSTNWSSSALNSNHEANLLIVNKEVAQEYEAYFNSLWSTGTS